jgi:hypothetical protein
MSEEKWSKPQRPVGHHPVSQYIFVMEVLE